MQIDMHYYGTYAMARAAGLTQDVSTVIATAAQFVDDNGDKAHIEFPDGGRLDSQATAHHAFHHRNIDPEDQRQIWVPFHFLPGNKGDSYTQKLICEMNSPVVEEMVQFNLAQIDQPYALPLLGITAHVYADTFSHYGFSGVSSRKNKIINDSFKFHQLAPKMKKYIIQKAKQFEEEYSNEGILDNIKSWFAETFSGALGHGAVVTFPDRPYLIWEFTYEDPKKKSGVRNNPETYLQCARGLHGLFSKAAENRPELSDGKGLSFSKIEGRVKDIIGLQAPKADRIAAWKRAAQSRKLFAAGAEEIPDYDGGSQWLNERHGLCRAKDSSDACGTDIFRFYQAASVHRVHVLRHLLPKHGLVVA